MNFCRGLREEFKDIVVLYKKGSEGQRNKGSKVRKKNLAKALSRKVFFFILLCVSCDFEIKKTSCLRVFVAKKNLANLCVKPLCISVVNPSMIGLKIQYSKEAFIRKMKHYIFLFYIFNH